MIQCLLSIVILLISQIDVLSIVILARLLTYSSVVVNIYYYYYLQSLIDRIDKDGSGEIEYEEFKILMTATN